MQGRIVRYRFTGDARSIAQRAEEGVLPMFQGMPGFQAYSVVEAGDEIISFSAWDTREEAEAASAAVADWVKETKLPVEPIDARYGEILFSTTLGITTKAGITV
jgi:hypothetical protein